MPNWRVLVVDDDPDVCKILQRTLQKKYEVVTVLTGREAVNGLDRVEPDFIILDVRIPDLDGFQICRRIRSDARFRHTPILFLSAMGDHDQVRQGYDVGGNLYLTKPFDPIRLLKNIEVFIERKPPAFHRKRYTLDDLALFDFAERPKPLNGGQVRQARPAAAPTPPAAPAPAPPASPGPEAEELSDIFPAAEALEEVAYDFGVSGENGDALAGTPGEAPATAPVRAASRAAGAAGELPSAEFVAFKKPAEALSNNGLRPRLLCVIDDSQELLDIAEACDAQFEFVWACDGVTAYERLQAYEPDVIMLEALLPKMSGFQLCQAIRRSAAFGKTPIVFYTARAGARELGYAEQSGANGLIKRPAPPARIASIVREQFEAAGAKIRPKARAVEELLDLIEADKKRAAKRPARKAAVRGTALTASNDFERFMRDNSSTAEEDI